jgi:hypothetical protein
MIYLKMSNLLFRNDPKEVEKIISKKLELAEYERGTLVEELIRMQKEDEQDEFDPFAGVNLGDEIGDDDL